MTTLRTNPSTAALSLLACLLVASCKPPEQLPPSEKVNWKIVNDAGRYQMIPGVRPANIAILDTQTGRLQNCFLVDARYHCLAQTNATSMEGGLPEQP